MPLPAQPSQSQQGGVLSLQPLKVQNLEPNVAVFAKMVNGDPTFRVIFQPNGHVGDTQRMPVSLAEDIEFLNSLERGTLKVVGGPQELVEALQFETEALRAERAEAAARQTEILDRQQDRDIIGAKCIGPAPAGRSGTCDRSLIQSAKTSADTPPLCSQHKELAPTFYLAESGSRGRGATDSSDGVIRREWKPITLTERQKQSTS
jgi:hypothetical protein